MRRSLFVVPAATLSEPMRVEGRTLSPYQLSAACQTPHRIARLEAPMRTLELRVGQTLTLSTLGVVAINDANRAVPGVPVALDAESGNPSVLELSSDDADVQQGRVRALRAGAFRVRVRTICTNQLVDLMLTGRVLP